MSWSNSTPEGSPVLASGNCCRIKSNQSDSPWLQRGEGIICGHSLSGCVKLPSCPQTYFWKEPQLLNGTWAPLCVAVCVCLCVQGTGGEQKQKLPLTYKHTLDCSAWTKGTLTQVVQGEKHLHSTAETQSSFVRVWSNNRWWTFLWENKKKFQKNVQKMLCKKTIVMYKI